MMRFELASVTTRSPLTWTCCSVSLAADAAYSCDSATELTFWFQKPWKSPA